MLIALFIGFPLLAPFAGLANRPLSKGESPFRGLLLPTLLALLSACLTGILFLTRGFFTALVGLALFNLPVFVSLTVYLVLRIRRHHALLEKYRAEHPEKKPPLVASRSFRASLNGFSCPSSLLSTEAQHEVLILLKSGTPPEKLVGIYNCPAAELRSIESAFARYQKEKKAEADGVDYTVTPEQAAFFLQLMINATPKGLECGEGMLWSRKSLRRLIHKASQNDPSDRSVAIFLARCGLTVGEEELAVTKTAAAQSWCAAEYPKIRLSALETGAALCWVYTLTPKLPGSSMKKVRVHTALDQNGEALFGIYKGTGGFADFLNKLAQEKHRPLFAVICSDLRDYKNLNNLHPDLTLFPLGEPARIPEN